MAAKEIENCSLDSDNRTMQEIWESPTKEEVEKIELEAFKNTDENKLFWGCETIERN